MSDKKIIGCGTGRSGSGKNFVLNYVEEQYDLPIITVSEILGRSRDKKAPSGESIGSIMDRGEIVPVRIVLSLLEDEIINSKADKLIINGFPRTIEQASFLETQNEFLPIVFYLNVNRKTCIDRVLNSPKVGDRGARADDSPEKIIIRQDIFERDTLPAIKYLEGGGIVPVVTLDGRKSREINSFLIIKKLREIEKTGFSLVEK